ncbi:MAG TPA: serine--tRNA ligase [Ktedonobacterales bacterium]
MLHLDFIRQHPDLVRDALRKRGANAPLEEVLAFAEQRAGLITRCDALRAKHKREEERLRDALRAASPAVRKQLSAPLQAAQSEIKKLEIEIGNLESDLHMLLLQFPNLPHSSVPEGSSENDNSEIRRWGEPVAFLHPPAPHWELGERLKLIDFERGVKIAGTRFYIMRGLGARLERALLNFMLDVHTTEHDYLEVFPPFLVKRAAMLGTGQLPKFEDDAYHCTEDDLFLNPTAEVPVTNLHRDEILEPGTLPIRYAAATVAFRREAGSAGRDTRGLTRVHQFNKVELVQLVEPDHSYEALEGLVADVEDILQRLVLPYRVMLVCVGDLGFSAAKTYDLEVWMPGQQRFVEVSSVSNCETFQARRASIKYRPANDAHAEYAHTLNGSGLAVGRTLAAILENYQQADGSIVVPSVLRPYMGVATIEEA